MLGSISPGRLKLFNYHKWVGVTVLTLGTVVGCSGIPYRKLGAPVVSSGITQRGDKLAVQVFFVLDDKDAQSYLTGLKLYGASSARHRIIQVGADHS